MASLVNKLSLCSFNCRSLKNCFSEVCMLCDQYDIVAIQEHWLLPTELSMLSSIHSDYLASGTSAINVTSDICTGRPYGGTAILYNKKLVKAIQVVDINEARYTAITVTTDVGPMLLVNVYMPTDYGDLDCYTEYVEMCAKISTLYSDSDAVFLIVIGDFNCTRPLGFVRSSSSFSLTMVLFAQT